MSSMFSSIKIDARIEAIYALRGSNFKETEGSLLDAVADPDSLIRQAGLTVLLESWDEKYLPLASQALNDEDDQVRKLAGKFLKQFKNGRMRRSNLTARPSVSDCLKALEAKSVSVRQSAVDSLVGVTDPRIIQPLLAVLKRVNDSESTRLTAMDTLDYFVFPEWHEELYSLLSDKDIGHHAARKLADKSDPGANALLLKALHSQNRVAQISAANYIACTADVRALGPLSTFLVDENPVVRTIAINSLADFWFQSTSNNNELIALEGANRLIVASLFEATEDLNKDVRITALRRLSHIDKPLATAALLKAIKDIDNDVRGAALTLLSEIDNQLAVPVILVELERLIATQNDLADKADPWHYDYYQTMLFAAITDLGDKVFCDLLAQLSRSNNCNLRIDSANALLTLGDDRGVGMLEDALDNDDWVVRVKAAEILLGYGISRAWDALVIILKNDVDDLWFIKVGIIDSMAKSGDTRTLDLFLDILNNIDVYSVGDETIGSIIKWLGIIGDSRAIESIRKWQYKDLINCDEDVAENALRSLDCEI